MDWEGVFFPVPALALARVDMLEADFVVTLDFVDVYCLVWFVEALEVLFDSWVVRVSRLAVRFESGNGDTLLRACTRNEFVGASKFNIAPFLEDEARF